MAELLSTMLLAKAQKALLLCSSIAVRTSRQKIKMAELLSTARAGSDGTVDGHC
jgi:hypothetical protein